MARWEATADGGAVNLDACVKLEPTDAGRIVAVFGPGDADRSRLALEGADRAEASELIAGLTAPRLERVRTEAHALIELALAGDEADDAEVARLVVEAVVAIVDGLRS